MENPFKFSAPMAMIRRLYHSNRFARRLLAAPAGFRWLMLEHKYGNQNAVARRLGERIVGDVVIDVPEFSGQFACSPQSDLFHRIISDGQYEPAMAELLRKHLVPTRDFVDVGANIGFYSVLAAKVLTTGRVLAFEPNPAAHRRLNDNLSRNHVADRVEVFQGLASDCEGEAELHLIEGMEEYSSMGQIIHRSVKDQAKTSTIAASTTVDQLVSRFELSPAVIKIDVEGAEQLVINGALETLRRFRPVVIAECSRALLSPMGATPEAIIAGFEDLGYLVFDADDPTLAPASRDYGDILCLPGELL